MPSHFDEALAVGRPPNITRLFPHSKALIVSGKVIDRAMLAKGKAIAMAANGRNQFVIRGALRAAQRANAALIIEIAKSEGGRERLLRSQLLEHRPQVDAFCNELGITVPVAIHADHYGIKGEADVEKAKVEIPSMFDAGMTSIAIDASHLPDDENLLASIELNRLRARLGRPRDRGRRDQGQGGPLHGRGSRLPDSGAQRPRHLPRLDRPQQRHHPRASRPATPGIQVELTAEIHEALASYGVSGAQHGTSGNSSDRLRSIATETRTTKANVATALQMISWGLEVNDYGNAILDEEGNFSKVKDEGVTESMWAEMVEYAASKGLKGGDYKKLNLPFENKLLGLPARGPRADGHGGSRSSSTT